MRKHSNVIRFGAWREKQKKADRIVRLAPELDGLETLYSNDANPGVCFNLKVPCWALKASGEVVGLVPWLSDIIECPRFSDPLNGYWAGYRDPFTEEIFYQPPDHKIAELKTASDYFSSNFRRANAWVQELPDNLGTHALFTADDFKTIALIEVVSWRLLKTGRVLGMLPEYEKITDYPILFNEKNLYAAQDHPHFKYFFHFSLVDRIKKHDPEAMNALSLLCHPSKR
jgi:hypothetical protein